MPRKTPVDKLSAEISSILEEYSEEVASSLRESVKEVSKAGTKAIRALSKQTFKGSGDYAKGWTNDVNYKGKKLINGTIYNKIYQLPHLLEHGHLNRDGTRTPGRLHISVVEQQIIEDFEKAVYKNL